MYGTVWYGTVQYGTILSYIYDSVFSICELTSHITVSLQESMLYQNDKKYFIDSIVPAY